MRIVPVIDILNGVVVRAVGGRRAEYRPVVSRLTASTEPLAVAEALLDATGASELYVADLDAITRGRRTPHPPTPSESPTSPPRGEVEIRPPSSPLPAGGRSEPERSDGSGRGVEMPPVSIAVHRLVRELSATVWLDTGVRGPFEVLHLERFRNVRPIVASETLGIGPLIRAIPEELFRLRPAVSIDLRDGNLVTDEANPSTPTDFATKMYRFGFRTFILLDLARVGMNAGPGTESLCDELRRLYPDIELLVGGGVRNRDDIKRLEDAGADGVLVASALHDGTLP